MNLRQLAAELRSVREDLAAVRKALEEKHCPPGCSCRPVQWTNSPTLTTGVAGVAFPLTYNVSGSNWMGT